MVERGEATELVRQEERGLSLRKSDYVVGSSSAFGNDFSVTDSFTSLIGKPFDRYTTVLIFYSEYCSAMIGKFDEKPNSSISTFRPSLTTHTHPS